MIIQLIGMPEESDKPDKTELLSLVMMFLLYCWWKRAQYTKADPLLAQRHDQLL